MNYEHGQYLLIVDHGHGCINISAVPDHGETIRCRFFFYTTEEAIKVMKEKIDQLID